MLLVTTFVELRVVDGRSRTRAGRPRAVSGWLMLIQTCHAVPCRAVPWPWEVTFRTAWSWHDMCESNMAALCNQMGKTQSKPSAARHGRRLAWVQHGMCELALTGSREAMCCRTLRLLSKWILLLYDNASPHTLLTLQFNSWAPGSDRFFPILPVVLIWHNWTSTWSPKWRWTFKIYVSKLMKTSQ
jgi:hypothetical protein